MAEFLKDSLRSREIGIAHNYRKRRTRMNGLKKCRPLQGILLIMVALAGLSATGCTSDIAGQTLPSPYYLTDDVQYFPAGSEFVLAREAAAMKAYKEGAPAVEAVPVVEPTGEAVEAVPAPVAE